MKIEPNELNSELPGIAYLVGGGTGPYLAEIFNLFIQGISSNYYGKKVDYYWFPHKSSGKYFHTFQSIEEASREYDLTIKSLSDTDVEKLLEAAEICFEHGIKTIFRTAINAESLYMFRQQVKAVKEFGLNTPDGKQVLFVRDQAEGFYANTTYNITDEQIDFTGIFTKEHQKKLVKFGIKRAYEKFGNSNFEKVLICKHHLFGNVLESWYKEAAIEENVFDLQVFQPDTGLTLLNNYFYPTDEKNINNNLLVICSNEVGDVIYEALMKMIDPSAKLYLFSRNTYLADPFKGALVEFQTIHGSADDLIDKNNPGRLPSKLLPYATFLIAAEFCEKDLSIPGIKNKMDEAIVQCRRQFRNNEMNTEDLVDFIFRSFKLSYHERK